jgi:Fe-S cluster assembly protein SufD
MTQLAQPKSIRTLFGELSPRGNGPAWLDDLRSAATEQFDRVGFPLKTQEDWRFTDVSPIARTTFVTLDASTGDPSVAEKFSFGQEAIVELVFVNGHFVAQLSKLGKLPRGVKVGSLRQAIELDADLVESALAKHADIEKNPFVALNTGLVQDGAFLFLPRGTTLEGVVHFLFVSTTNGGEPTASHPRALVIAEDNVEAQVVETYAGADGATYFTNAVSEFVLGNDCRIDHNKMNQESLGAYHVATMQATLGRATTFVSHSTTLGGKLTRNNLNCKMAGEGAYAILNGLVVIGGRQHCDNHTLLDHAMPNCPSHELYKHVLDDKSTGVFKGKILVRQHAQKTDSKQTSKSLLLSDDATMNSQPALEIYADDVKCTHGSTIGPVDEDMVYYARTRGIGEVAARHLLTYAFAADVTRRIKVNPVRRRIEDFMANRHGLPHDIAITDLGDFDEAAL